MKNLQFQPQLDLQTVSKPNQSQLDPDRPRTPWSVLNPRCTAVCVLQCVRWISTNLHSRKAEPKILRSYYQTYPTGKMEEDNGRRYFVLDCKCNPVGSHVMLSLPYNFMSCRMWKQLGWNLQEGSPTTLDIIQTCGVVHNNTTRNRGNRKKAREARGEREATGEHKETPVITPLQQAACVLPRQCWKPWSATNAILIYNDLLA